MTRVKRFLWPSVASVTAAFMLLAFANPARGTQEVPDDEALDRGFVETIAGPTYCDGVATVDPASTEVGALAVNEAGDIFVDTGPPSEGLIAKVDRTGRARTVRSGTPRGVPGRLASDSAGTLFVAAGRRIDELLTTGGITTLAGDPVGNDPAASGGDGGPARAARFAAVRSVATDAAGNLYVADEIDGDRAVLPVRFVNRSSDPVTFLAGTPQEVTVLPGNIDTVMRVPLEDGPRTSQTAGTRGGVTPVMATAPGRLYVGLSRATPPRAVVMLANLNSAPLRAHGITVEAGSAQIIAGGGRSAARPANGRTSGRDLASVAGITSDAAGNLYIAEQAHHRVYRVGPDGAMSTFAGATGARPGARGFNGNERPALGARLDRPFDVKAGPVGLIYISDQRNGVRFVDPSGTIHAAPGNGLGLRWACQRASGGTPERPRVGVPQQVAADDQGRVYVVTDGTPQVYRWSPQNTVDLAVGDVLANLDCRPPSNCPNGDGGPATKARLRDLGPIASGPGGRLYLVDGGRIRLANLGTRPLRAHGRTVAAGAVETVLGEGTTAAGGDAVGAFAPASLAADRHGNLLIADADDERQRLLQLDAAGTLTAVGATTAEEQGCCGEVHDLAVDPDGNLYVLDGARRRVWFINRSTKRALTVHGHTVAPGQAKLVAGSGKRGFSGEGQPALDTPLDHPVAVAVDGAQNLYISDQGAETGQHSVRRVGADGVMRTAVGTGSGTFNGDGLKGRLTSLNYPVDLAVDRCGNVIIADMVNQRVRRLNQGSCRPASQAGQAAAASGARRTMPLLVFGLAGGIAGIALTLFVRTRLRRRSGPPPLAAQPQTEDAAGAEPVEAMPAVHSSAGQRQRPAAVDTHDYWKDPVE